ncbi:MAG: DUF3617 domain-containing protein [Sphingomicrobium sp.]
MNAFWKTCLSVLVALPLGAASASIFATAEPGLWEVSRAGSQPVKLCVANTAILAQFEHRNSKCSRTVLRDSGSAATVHYSCAGGDFGQTDLRLVTPRSLTIQTQGISGGAPFKYTLLARRTGNCQNH